jgi:hypothetical protein
MIDYFIDWQYEGGFCFQIESTEIINPDLEQCNELLDDLESMVLQLTIQRDLLKEIA